MINSRSIKQERHVTLMGEKKSLVKLQSKCEVNLLYLQEVVCGVVDWINVSRDRDHWRPLKIKVAVFPET